MLLWEKRGDVLTEDRDFCEVLPVEFSLCTMLRVRGHLVFVIIIDFSLGKGRMFTGELLSMGQVSGSCTCCSLKRSCL